MNLNITDRQMREGRELLQRLLPDLRRQISLARPDGIIQPTSLLGQSLMGRIRFANLDALVIRRSAAGWHADLVLTGMPVGVSNVMGTPEAMPLPDRASALEAGTDILRQIARLALENEIAVRDMPETDVRPFALYGHTFELSGPAVDQIAQLWAAIGRDLIPDRETARARLIDTLVDLMGADRFDPDRYASLSDEDKGRISVGIATLLVFGEFRHPDRPVAAPAGEGPSP